MNASGAIILTVLLSVGSAEAKRLVTGKGFDLHPVLQGFIMGTFLYVFALVNTELAIKFCYLVMTIALITNGGAIVTTLNATSSRPNSAASSKTGGSTGKGYSGGGGGGGGGGGR